MAKKEDMFKEAREITGDGFIEQSKIKKVVADKRNQQFSFKIPKNLATKSFLKESSKFRVVFNPSQETLEEIKTSKLVIYLKE